MSVTTPFRHEAFLYDSDDSFVSVLTGFVREGLEADEGVFVLLNRRKTEVLRDGLGADADRVRWEEMESLGRNPARIIPAWRQFVDEAMSPRMRGIGEPIWSGRSDQEIVECHVHESLVNVAFENTDDLWLVCPYDKTALPATVIERASRTHPTLRDGDAVMSLNGQRSYGQVFDDPLPPPPPDQSGLVIRKATLSDIRAVVAAHAAAAGLDADRVHDLMLAVSELATNSLRYGGGEGELWFWEQDGTLIHEVRDTGHVLEPLIGRSRPSTKLSNGRGLWLVNQFCDLVQIRSSESGTIVRIHTRLR